MIRYLLELCKFYEIIGVIVFPIVNNKPVDIPVVPKDKESAKIIGVARGIVTAQLLIGSVHSYQDYRRESLNFRKMANISLGQRKNQKIILSLAKTKTASLACLGLSFGYYSAKSYLQHS